MSFEPSARLKGHIEAITNRACSPPDIIEVFRLTRQIIEKDQHRLQYPHLSLYCDWVQHIEIDRHPHGYVMLESMNNEVIKHWAQTDGLVTAISQSFGLASLRQELILLFMSKGISTILFDFMENWKKLVATLLDDICHKPVRLATKGRRDIFDRMRGRWAEAGLEDVGPVRAMLIELETEAKEGIPLGYYWIVELQAKLTGNDHLNLRGLIEFTELASAFATSSITRLAR